MRRTRPGRAPFPYLDQRGRSDDSRLLELTLASGADVDAKDSYHDRADPGGGSRLPPRRSAPPPDGDRRRPRQPARLTALLEAVILGGGDAAHTEVVQVLVDAASAPTSPTGAGQPRSTTPARADTAASAAILLGGRGEAEATPRRKACCFLETRRRRVLHNPAKTPAGVSLCALDPED